MIAAVAIGHHRAGAQKTAEQGRVTMVAAAFISLIVARIVNAAVEEVIFRWEGRCLSQCSSILSNRASLEAASTAHANAADLLLKAEGAATLRKRGRSRVALMNDPTLPSGRPRAAIYCHRGQRDHIAGTKPSGRRFAFPGLLMTLDASYRALERIIVASGAIHNCPRPARTAGHRSVARNSAPFKHRGSRVQIFRSNNWLPGCTMAERTRPAHDRDGRRAI